MILTAKITFAIVAVMKAIDHLKILISAGWSQGRIARESGIAQPSINRLLNGRQTDVHYSQGKVLEQLAAKVASGATAESMGEAA